MFTFQRNLMWIYSAIICINLRIYSLKRKIPIDLNRL